MQGERQPADVQHVVIERERAAAANAQDFRETLAVDLEQAVVPPYPL